MNVSWSAARDLNEVTFMSDAWREGIIITADRRQLLADFMDGILNLQDMLFRYILTTLLLSHQRCVYARILGQPAYVEIIVVT